MWWIGCICCEKFRHDFVDFCIICTNSAHFAPSFMQQPNGPKCTQTLRNPTKDEFGVQWGWIGCDHCENIWRDFVTWTFAFIAPVQPILHRVSCTNKMVQNAPKHYETHQNMSLRSDGVDRADLLQKILTQLCGLNFYINYNSSARVELSIVKQRNGPKCPQTLQNKTKHEFRVQWGWINCIRCEKFGHDFVAWTFALIALVQPILHRVSCTNEMVPNAPKHYENTTKDEFRVQWGGSGAFIVKTSGTTSWHELLH